MVSSNIKGSESSSGAAVISNNAYYSLKSQLSGCKILSHQD
jgi:hypothetical protein